MKAKYWAGNSLSILPTLEMIAKISFGKGKPGLFPAYDNQSNCQTLGLPMMMAFNHKGRV